MTNKIGIHLAHETTRHKKRRDIDLLKCVEVINVPAWKHKLGSFQEVSPLHLAEEKWKDALHCLCHLPYFETSVRLK